MGHGDFDLGPEQWATLRRLLDQALDEGVSALGPRHLLVMRARVGMANVLRFRGRIPEMQAERDAVRTDMDATPGVPVKDRIALLENLAHLAIKQGRYADADAAARAIGELAARHDPRHPKRQVAALMMVALAASYSGDHERSLAASAEPSLRAAHAHWQGADPRARWAGEAADW